MENSILISTKKILGVAAEYTVFDEDILICINSALSDLAQIGIGPKMGFMIDDDSSTWTDFIGDDPQLSSVKTFVYLRTRMLFDPPATSFAIEAMNKQIEEHIWRLSTHRESNVISTLPTRLREGVCSVD